MRLRLNRFISNPTKLLIIDQLSDGWVFPKWDISDRVAILAHETHVQGTVKHQRFIKGSPFPSASLIISVA